MNEIKWLENAPAPTCKQPSDNTVSRVGWGTRTMGSERKPAGAVSG